MQTQQPLVPKNAKHDLQQSYLGLPAGGRGGSLRTQLNNAKSNKALGPSNKESYHYIYETKSGSRGCWETPSPHPTCLWHKPGPKRVVPARLQDRRRDP